MLLCQHGNAATTALPADIKHSIMCMYPAGSTEQQMSRVDSQNKFAFAPALPQPVHWLASKRAGKRANRQTKQARVHGGKEGAKDRRREPRNQRSSRPLDSPSSQILQSPAQVHPAATPKQTQMQIYPELILVLPARPMTSNPSLCKPAWKNGKPGYRCLQILCKLQSVCLRYGLGAR